MAEQLASDAVQGGTSPLHRFLHTVSTVVAGAGGILIAAVALVVTYSVIMSNLNLGGARGEFELVELACIASGSLFLPLCQLNKGHVMVDVFTGWVPREINEKVDAFWTFLFAAAWAVVCWRLCYGLLDIHEYGDKTMLLGAPIWWAYVPAIIGTGLSALIALLSSMSVFMPGKLQVGLSQ